MNQTILNQLQSLRQNKRKGLAILLDPDKAEEGNLAEMLEIASQNKVDLLLVGGSLLVHNYMDRFIKRLKAQTNIPIALFPGSVFQIHADADAILFLSLISGRNPELLIGKQVEAAPLLREMDIEVIPTGYMLIDGGSVTTAHYISGTSPIPHNKPEIAACTALAGAYLGLQIIYMDAGSGAAKPISQAMIQAVSREVDLPLIVGGGIRTAQAAQQAWDAGAELVVVGNALEKGGGEGLLTKISNKKFQKLSQSR